MGKRGTKPKAGKRERNGQLSRKARDVEARGLEGMDQEQRATLAVGLEARERVFGVAPQHSRDQKAGTAIGRFCLTGRITQPQYDAAMAFLESYHRNLLAIDAPKMPGAVNLNATRGRPVGVENVAQLTRWRQEHAAALAAIQSKQIEIGMLGNLYGSLYAMLIRDTELDHLLGDVRVALNALVRHYRLHAVAA